MKLFVCNLHLPNLTWQPSQIQRTDNRSTRYNMKGLTATMFVTVIIYKRPYVVKPEGGIGLNNL